MKAWKKTVIIIGLILGFNLTIIPTIGSQVIRNDELTMIANPNSNIGIAENESVPTIGADYVWTHLKDYYGDSLTGANTIIGIIDTGIDYRHPDFFLPNWSAHYEIVSGLIEDWYADMNGNSLGDLDERLRFINTADGDIGFETEYDWLYVDRNSNDEFNYGTDYYAQPLDENRNGFYDIGETVVLLTESKILEIIDMTTGKNWTQTQIETGMAATYDYDGHGTNIAGIAAGGQVKQNGERFHKFTGVAPNANLVVIKIGNQTKNLYNDTKLLNAIIMIKEKNIDVLSLSLGAYIWRNLDGTSAIEMLIDSLEFPVVVAAGNLQNKFIHRSDTIVGGQIIYLPFLSTISTQEPSEIRWNVIWDSLSENFSFILRYHGAVVWPAPGPPNMPPLFPPNDAIVLGTGRTVPQIGIMPVTGVTVKWWRQDSALTNMFCVQMTKPGVGINPDQWSIEVSGGIGSAALQSYIWDDRNQFINGSHALGPYPIWAHWGYIIALGVPNTYRIQANPEFTITHPATATNAIAVGAFDLATKNLCSFSSLGSLNYNSTMDGYQKPDLCAPGADSTSYGINSSVSRNATGTDISFWTSHNIAYYGTSQAAPHVAGTIALMLQKNDSLSITEIKTILRQTTTRDGFVGVVPNYRWGYGKLNVTGAVNAVLLTLESTLKIPWWVWVIIAGLVIAVVAIIVVRKKKKSVGA